MNKNHSEDEHFKNCVKVEPKYSMMEILSKYDLSRLIFEAMNKRDFSGLEAHIVENVAFDFPGAGRIEGYRRVIIFIKALMRKYSELNFTIHEVIIDGDKSCTVWTNKGKTIEGEDYANSGMTLFYFEDNKITFISDYFKNTSFVK